MTWSRARFFVAAAWSASVALSMFVAAQLVAGCGKERAPELLTVVAAPPAADPAKWEKVEFVEPKTELLRQGSKSLSLTLGDASVEFSRSPRSSNDVWLGASLDGSTAVFAFDGDIVFGNVRRPDGTLVQISCEELDAQQRPRHSRRTIDRSKLPPGRPARPAARFAAPPTCSKPDSGRVEVAVYHTEAAEKAAGCGPGAIAAAIRVLIAEANLSIHDQAAFGLTLAHQGKVRFTETIVDAGGMDADLSALEDIANPMKLFDAKSEALDDVHEARDWYGADAVVLITNSPDGCGLANQFSPDTPNAAEGFATVEFGCATRNLTFVHELGHLLGADHEEHVADSSYPYGHAAFDCGKKMQTVMGTLSTCCGQPCFRQNIWSSPLGVGDAMHDNARALKDSYAKVASYRCGR